jgi:deoxyribodipyrimidine photo-lyase
MTFRKLDLSRSTLDLIAQNFVGLYSGDLGLSSNEGALRKLQLSSRRIGFYLQTLQDLAKRRDLTVYLGDPYQLAAENDVAVTYAPVPSFKKFSKLAELHPYPWLRLPHAGSVRSFSSWRAKLESKN